MIASKLLILLHCKCGIGKNKYTIDLDGLSSGIYRAVISSTNIQDAIKFSVGLEPWIW